MKLHRLFNLTELAPAAGMHFFAREDALKYRELVLWPYVNEGRWPLPDGSTIPLESLDLRVETVEMPLVVDKTLLLVLTERDGKLGGAPLLPGNCFDPDEWEACTAAELAHPVHGTLLQRAQQLLKDGGAGSFVGV